MIVLKTGIILIILSLTLLKKKKYPLGFLFVLLIMGFQDNIQSDYIGYQETFEMHLQSRTDEKEPVWDILSSIVRPLGWYAFVFILALFECFMFYKLTEKYTSKRYIWVAPILYFFTYGMMCEQMNTMRQALAIAICMLPFLFNIERKKQRWLYYAVPLVIAYLTHNSAIVMLIPIALYYLQNENGLRLFQTKQRSEWILPVVVTGLLLVLYSLKTFVLDTLFLELSVLTNDADMRLSDYLMERANGGIFNQSRLIILYDVITVFFMALTLQQSQGARKILFFISIIGCYLDVLLFGMGTMPRLGYYFIVANCVTIPLTCEFISKRYGKIPVSLFIIFCIAYAVKTSLPFMINSGWCQYGDYKFVFMN